VRSCRLWRSIEDESLVLGCFETPWSGGFQKIFIPFEDTARTGKGRSFSTVRACFHRLCLSIDEFVIRKIIRRPLRCAVESTACETGEEQVGKS